MSNTIAKASLFNRIGGMKAVDAAVKVFYNHVIQDDRINTFFEHVDMEAQSGKMKAFLAFAFGAPMNYTGKDMSAAHSHMQLTEEHFNAVAENLVTTLESLEVPKELIHEVLVIAASTKDDVLQQ